MILKAKEFTFHEMFNFLEEKFPFVESSASKVVQHSDLDQKNTLDRPFCPIKPIRKEPELSESTTRVHHSSGPVNHGKVPTIAESETPGASYGSEVVGYNSSIDPQETSSSSRIGTESNLPTTIDSLHGETENVCPETSLLTGKRQQQVSWL